MMPLPAPRKAAALCALLWLTGAASAGSLRVQVLDSAGKPLEGAVVSLVSDAARRAVRPLPEQEIAQENKQFVPAVRVVTVGTLVRFPNRDSVRHHVYSFSPAKKFEIKLYAGTPAAPVLFDQPCNALLIPKRDIAGKLMPERDPVLLMLVQDAIVRLGGQQSPQCLVDQARGLVRDALPLGEPSLERVAAGLGLTPAALQRRLREQNLSFSTLIDQVRRELALHYLRRRLPVSELAPLLGYSETSAFSRAFRRWFDASPRQWLQMSTA